MNLKHCLFLNGMLDMPEGTGNFYAGREGVKALFRRFVNTVSQADL